MSERQRKEEEKDESLKCFIRWRRKSERYDDKEER